MFSKRSTHVRVMLTATLIPFAMLFSGCSDSPEVDLGKASDQQASPETTSGTTSADATDPQTTASAADIATADLPVANATSTESVAMSTIALTPAEPAAADSLNGSVPDVVEIPKSKREPIYIEEANGKELIATAMKEAQRDHKHVLIEWGGNWCGWCFKLHDVFHKDAAVRPIVHEEFVLVLIDQGKNKDLMLEYGGADRQYSYPHLTILDEQGSVLTNQETGSLEEGSNHDPKLVTAFLNQWTPEKIDAEALLADALKKAADEKKNVMVRVGTPYCGWCNILASFMQDHESLLSRDYVDIKIDTMRMVNSEQVASLLAPQKNGGVPWMVLLDPSGKELSSSFAPDGNIGYPYQPEEIAYFISMLRSTRTNLTDDDLQTIAADLNAYRETQEAKRR